MRTDLQVIASAHLAEGTDPITAFLTRDWASLGGWSLFIGLCLYIVVGSIREWWVPGAVHRRVEARAEAAETALKLTQDALETALDQNGKLLKSSEVIEYVLREILPGIKAKGGDTS